MSPGIARLMRKTEVSNESSYTGKANVAYSFIGAEEAGRIFVDLTELKTENKIMPVTLPNADGKSYEFYEVEFDLWLIIEGRNLRFEARSPSEPQAVKACTQFSIAAGFVPGTV